MFYKLFLLFSLSSFLCASSEGEPPTIPAVVIGGGIGGSTAAIYLARAHFEPLVIEGTNPGGALSQSDAVENWPGSSKVRGEDLMEQIREQAIKSGAHYVREEVVRVDFSKRPFLLQTRSLDHPEKIKSYRAASCIIATGSKPNYLGVEGEGDYWGQGVSNCAICDGSLYEKKRVGIVGGGDSAVLEALYLSNIAKEVNLFVRKDRFRAMDETRKAALLAQPNVKVFFQTEVKGIVGNENQLTGVRLAMDPIEIEMPLDGLFLAIGSKPNTELFKGQLDMDSFGYLSIKEGNQTSIPYVYAIGDAVDPLYKQAVCAAGDAAKAALAIQTKLSADAPALLAAYHKAFFKNPLNQPVCQDPVIVEISSRDQFEEELRSSSLPVVVDFYATWCPPCKRIASMLETSAKQLEGKFKFLKVNVDMTRELMSSYHIRSMPTVLLFDPDGLEIKRKVGEREINELFSQLAQ